MRRFVSRLVVTAFFITSLGCGGGAGDASTGAGSTGADQVTASSSASTGGSSAVGAGGASGGAGGGSGGAISSTGGGAPVTFDAGAYALLGSEAPPDTQALADPYIAGLAVRTAWSSHEPSEGQYDFSYLDTQIAAAKAASKKISIYMEVGAPDWLYAAGAKSITLVTNNGKVRTIPVPWDPTFLTKFERFIQEFGARYAQESTISYVRGASEALTNGWGLSWTDSSGKPLSDYGYQSPATLLDPLEAVLDEMMSAFPHTAEWVEIGIVSQTDGFAIDDVSYFGSQLADYGFAKYPDRMGAWREDLSGCTKNPPTRGDWLVLAAHPGHNGAQMVWNVQDGPPDFRMDGCKQADPNTRVTVLHNAVQKGLDFGMPYVEIYSTDCAEDDLQSVLQFASQSLH